MSNVRSLDEARDRVAETVQKTRDSVQEKVAEVRGHLDENLSVAAEKAREEVKKVAETARERAHEQAEIRSRQLREGYEAARVEGEKWAGEAGDYVQDHPGKALLLAAAAGFLFGLLLRPRR